MKSVAKSALQLTLFVLGIVVIGLVAVVAYILHSPDTFANFYLKPRLEERYAKKHPGVLLHIDSVHCDLDKQLLQMSGISYQSSDSTVYLTVAHGSMTDVDWLRISGLWHSSNERVSHTTLQLSCVSVLLRSSDYLLSCDSLALGLHDSSIVALGLSYTPRLADTAFFKQQTFRKCRYKLLASRLSFQGLDIPALLQGSGIIARSVDFQASMFDVRLHKYKPEAKLLSPVVMPAQQLMSAGSPIRIDSLRCSLQQLVYAECTTAYSVPAVVHFDDLNGEILGISNSPDSAQAITISAHGLVMKDGLMQVKISMPLTPSGLNYSLTGSLGPMKLNSLNQFVRESEHRRISDGVFKSARFHTETVNGHTRGHIDMDYKNLYITILDPKTGGTEHLGDRITTFLANLFAIHSSNDTHKKNKKDAGVIDYKIEARDSFVQAIWYSLRGGIAKVVGF